MGKGINKLSKAQRNAQPKTQTRISSFFGRAAAAPAPDAVLKPPTPALRRSPRKSPILIDVTEDMASPLEPPRSSSEAVSRPKTLPGVIIDLEDSWETVLNSAEGGKGSGPKDENHMTSITDVVSDAGAAAIVGVSGDDWCVGSGAGAAYTAAPDGSRLVQRLSKRPSRVAPGVFSDGKRSAGRGASCRPGGNTSALRKSPRKRKTSLESQDGSSMGAEFSLKPSLITKFPRKSPKKAICPQKFAMETDGYLLGRSAAKRSRDSELVELERALLAGEAIAGLPAAPISVAGDAVKDVTSVHRTLAPPVPGNDWGKLSAAPVDGAAAEPNSGASATNTAALAVISPQKRPRHRTPEPAEASELLFDSIADMFESPFKEEAAADSSAAAAVPLRSGDLSLPAWQRFDRYSVSFVDGRTDGSTVLSLQAVGPGQRDRSITLRGSWSSTRVQAGDVVHVLHAPGDVIDNVTGQLVVAPDRLISGTSVVSAVFCARKAVLSELFRGLEPTNKAMLVGTLVHQLFQEVIRNRLCAAAAIRVRVADLLRQNSAVSAAYGGKLSSAELAEELDQFVAPILSWVRRYTEWGRNAEVATPIAGKAATPAPRSDEIWDGRVTSLKDIEENYWSPRLGIKGKIDLTVEVKCRSRVPKVLPLELKTGRPSFSAEHQGQVTLYSMMTSERRDDPGAGLLLYLRTGAMREVTAGQYQQRDLLQLRNEMVHHLSAAPAPAASPGGSSDQLLLPPLPEVIANERACQRCPHLVACTAYQRPADPPHAVSDANSHLSASHLDYFLHWSLLLRLETVHSAEKASMARLWCRPAAERQDCGQALAGCRLAGVRSTPAGWVHRLERPAGASASQLSAGDLVMLGTERTLALCMGSLLEMTETEAAVLLDRDLTSYSAGAEQRYHVDKCEYQAETSMGTYFSSLARLLENSEPSRRLRELLIDRRPPSFLPGLGRHVITKCRAILRPLNKLQQRALLRVMMAEDYLLIQGMPGTGKTSTIVALVCLLVTMGRSVLLASYTHSAVDTILLKLKEKFTDFVRLGRQGRVHADLQSFCGESMTRTLNTPEEMENFYNSKPVVATTCLGTNHPVFQRRKFDICIIDEASQIVQPAAIAPVLLAGRFVLVGDPEQLPPVIQSGAARRRGMDECLFSRLAGEGNMVQLTVQYRMNRTLTAAANHLTYRGRLSCGSDTVGAATMQGVEMKPTDPLWLSTALDPALDRSLLLLDTSDLGWRQATDKHGAVTNAAEATLVAHIATELVQRGVSPESVGVIAPYRGQVKRLRAALPAGLEVNTVDQYQGRDKSVILYSCTRTAARRVHVTRDDVDVTESVDILSDHRRLTVAVTRAKHKLVLVGCRDALASYPPFCRLFEHLGAEHTVRLAPGQVSGLTSGVS